MELGGEPVGVDATPVDHALDQLRVAVDHLIKVVADGATDHYDDGQLIGCLQTFETLRNRLALVDHRLIRDCETRDLPGVFCQSTMVRLLMSALRLSPGEAARRVRAADQLGDQITPTGQPLPPLRPHLAAAQRAGTVSAESVDVVLRGLAGVDHRGFDPADVDAGEQLLASHAGVFGPVDLRQLTRRVVDAIDPDGTRPDDQLNADRRHLDLRRTRDGAFTLEGRLTGPLGTKLAALIGPLAKPRVNLEVTGNGRPVEEGDPRSHGQRQHDALDDLCDRLLRADLPDGGGVPATVIVTIDHHDLLTATGHGVASDGTVLSAAAVLDLAGQAEIIPTVLDRHGAVLDLGRSQRIATKAQTLALHARDGGCSFPGCTHPAPWCERHHIVPWTDGGLTDLDNLTLLCRYHHHHFLNRGWTVHLNHHRLPEWTPPRWHDPTQTPLLNHRITARTLTPTSQPNPP